MASPNDLFDQVKRFYNYRVEYRKINLLALSQIFVFELSLKRMECKGMLNKLKKYSLDNYVKAIISIFSIMKGKRKRSQYLFVNDVFNNSMVQNMKGVQKEFEDNYIELIADKRLSSHNSKLIFRYFKPFAFVREVVKVYSLLKKNRSTLDDLCAEFGIKRSLLTRNIIDSVFTLNCASNFLKSHPEITDIVLNTDVHKLSKALVFLSRESKINTYVIQHGSTVLEYGYLPVIADHMLSWGKLSNDWFIKRDTSEEKLVATGTPKMDGFVHYGDKANKLQKVQKVLLILNPIGDNLVRRLLQLIKDAELHQDYSLTIKLHPGSVDNRDLVDETFEEPQVEILKLANTHDLINQTDVVITTTSTVGNETIAFDKPLVQIKIADIDSAMDYEKLDCSHIVSGPEELKLLLRDTAKLVSKKANYPQFISDYFYSLDGKASFRIKEFVTGKTRTNS